MKYLKNKTENIIIRLTESEKKLIRLKAEKRNMSIDAEASQCVRELTEAFARADGITEQLKATNNLLWAKEMNNCKARAEEIVLREVVYR